jgi:peptidoglycan hydrolase-like protein with peptidoglycan-binding domain
MSMKKTKVLVGWLIGLTMAFSAAVGTGASSSLTAAEIDLLLSLGLISEEKAVAAKANLSRPAAITSTPSTVKRGVLFTKDMKVGSRGEDVAALQNRLGVSPATGRFGELTKAAVVKYQISKGISPANGYVGEKTRASLNADASAIPPP